MADSARPDEGTRRALLAQQVHNVKLVPGQRLHLPRSLLLPGKATSTEESAAGPELVVVLVLPPARAQPPPQVQARGPRPVAEVVEVTMSVRALVVVERRMIGATAPPPQEEEEEGTQLVVAPLAGLLWSCTEKIAAARARANNCDGR